MSTFTCHECGQEKPVQKEGGTGYATRRIDGMRVCYECCAVNDRADMIETGRATLYLETKAETSTYGRATVTNWPGTLAFDGRYSVGRHNIAGRRYDVSFVGPDGFMWSGIQYGDNTQICYCRRTKKRARI